MGAPSDRPREARRPPAALRRAGRALALPRGELLPVLAAGMLFGVAFPPHALVGPAFLCVAPVAAIVARRADAGRGAGGSLRATGWFALVGHALTLWWIAPALALVTAAAPLLAAVVVLGMALVVAATFGWGLHALRRATGGWPLAVLVPAAWVAGEWVLAHLGDLRFPWLPLALALTPVPTLAQVADLSGVHGASALVALVNGAAADAWLALRGDPTPRRPRAARSLALAAAAVAATWTYGRWRESTLPLVALGDVVAVQPDIAQTAKLVDGSETRAIGRLLALTREDGRERRSAGASAPLFAAWPETALDGPLLAHPDWRDSLRAAARAQGAPVLAGVIDVEPRDADHLTLYNAVLLTDRTGEVRAAPYRKRYLVPVVERVPFVDPAWLPDVPWLGGFGRGGVPEPFVVDPARPDVRVGVIVCYESVFGEAARVLRERGATLLVNATNDAWFGRTDAPWQHAAHLVLRAIETRAGVVRVGNSGPSAFVDPLGREHGRTPLFTARVVRYPVVTSTLPAPYVRLGDWLGALAAAATIAALTVDRVRVARQRGRAPRR